MTQGIFSWSLRLLAATLTVAVVQLQAMTHYISVSESGFAPATLNINVGDTVVWVNDDEIFSHTTTSDLGIFDPDYWNGVLVEFESSFSQTFNNVGTFTYHDQLDIGTGTITVSAPSATPIITLESPRLTDGQFLFEATGLTVGKTNVLLSSTNLTSWTAITTNVATASSITFTNAASLGQCFFQVVEQP
jgi:hypothetical protein